MFDKQALTRYFRVATDTIDRLVKAGGLRTIRIGHQVRFTLGGVEAFIQRQKMEGLKQTHHIVDREKEAAAALPGALPQVPTTRSPDQGDRRHRARAPRLQVPRVEDAAIEATRRVTPCPGRATGVPALEAERGS
jgi:excisionase family DNA binding protein